MSSRSVWKKHFTFAILISFVNAFVPSLFLSGHLILSLLFGFVGFILTAGFILVGVAGIDRLINGIKEHLKGTSQGKKTLDSIVIPKADGAVKSLITDFNKFIEQVLDSNIAIKNFWRKDYELGQDILSSSNSILEGTQSITKSADLLEKTTGKFDQRITESRQSIDEIQASLGSAQTAFLNQSSAVEESSAAIEELISSIRNIASISESKQSALNHLTELAEQGGKEISNTLKAFSSIGKTTELMMEMVSVISDIAERTNLLSMNAAIEAAHAGEKGRGFAVVAGEVGKLAESSRKNATSISLTLKGISGDIQKVSDSSSILGDNIHEILDKVRETSSSMGEILNGMTEMSVGTNQISSALNTLVETSANAKQFTDSVITNTGALQINLGDIEKHSKVNFSNLKDISKEVRRISDSLQHLFDISDDNSQNLTQMRKIIDRTGTAKLFVGDYLPPYQFIEGDRISGAFADTVKLISEELGEKEHIEFMPWVDAYNLTQNNPGVFMMTTLRTAVREKTFRWIGPIVPDKHYMYRLTSRTDIKVQSAGDLKHFHLGCVANNYAYKFYTDNGVPEEIIQVVDTQSMNIQNLLLGKVDMIPMSSLQVAYQLKTMKRTADTVTPAYPFTEFPTDAYMATSISTPDSVYQKYAEAFEKIKNTSRYKSILQKYSG